jgi:hypothetical protein
MPGNHHRGLGWLYTFVRTVRVVGKFASSAVGLITIASYSDRCGESLGTNWQLTLRNESEAAAATCS